jgi:hypothetical protein
MGIACLAIQYGGSDIRFLSGHKTTRSRLIFVPHLGLSIISATGKFLTPTQTNNLQIEYTITHSITQDDNTKKSACEHTQSKLFFWDSPHHSALEQRKEVRVLYEVAMGMTPTGAISLRFVGGTTCPDMPATACFSTVAFPI